MKRFIAGLVVGLILGSSACFGAVRGDEVLYLTGTVAPTQVGQKGTLNLNDPKVGVFLSGSNRLEIPYSQITKILYAQTAKRRYRSGGAVAAGVGTVAAAVTLTSVLSPQGAGHAQVKNVLLVGALSCAFTVPLLLTKHRTHYVTLFFMGEDGSQQTVAFEVGKNIVRHRIHVLETRTGRTVEFETEEASKNFGQ